MSLLEVDSVLQRCLIFADIEVKDVLVVLKHLLKDAVRQSHHESILVDEQDRFLTSLGTNVSLEGSHIRVEVKPYIVAAREDLIEHGIGHLLRDQQLGIEASEGIRIDRELIPAYSFKYLQGLFVLHWATTWVCRETICIRWLVVAVKLARFHLDEASHAKIPDFEDLVLRFVSEHA